MRDLEPLGSRIILRPQFWIPRALLSCLTDSVSLRDVSICILSSGLASWREGVEGAVSLADAHYFHYLSLGIPSVSVAQGKMRLR